MDPVNVVVVSAEDLQIQLARSLREVGAAVKIRNCARVAGLAALVSSASAQVIVAELRDAVGTSTVPALVDIKHDNGNTPIIVSVSLSQADMRRVVHAIGAGLSASWIIRDVDYLPAAITRAFAERVHVDAAALLLQNVWPVIAPRVREFFAVAAIGSTRPMSTLDAASILGVATRTLEGQLKAAGYPPPHRVLGWCRALHATWHFDRLCSTPKQVANRLKFPSIQAVYNLLQHYAVPRPGALRVEGGFEEALRRFVNDLNR